MSESPSSFKGNGMDPASMAEALAHELLRCQPATRWNAVARLMEALARSADQPREDPELVDLRARLRRSEEERAIAMDRLKRAQADGKYAEERLEAERKRAAEMQELVGSHEQRLSVMQQSLDQREAALSKRDQQVQQLQHELDTAKRAAARDSQGHLSEERVRKLQDESAELRQQLRLQRVDFEEMLANREAELRDLRDRPVAAAAAVGAEGEYLGPLWKRMVDSKLKLALPTESPKAGMLERLVDVIEFLTDSTMEVDGQMRLLLDKYASEHPRLKGPWQAYAKQPVDEIVRAAVSPSGGHPRLLSTRLRIHREWLRALLFGTDAAVHPQTVANTLKEHLLSTNELWNDRTAIRQYVKADGQLHFGEQLKKLRIDKILEALTKRGDG